MLKLFVLLFVIVGGVTGHRYGADIQACDRMKPGHGTTVRRTTATPYIIETNNVGYIPCSTTPLTGNNQMRCGVIVRIRSRQRRMAQPFKGFLLQARSTMPGGQVMNVGEFRYMNGQQVTARTNTNQMRNQFNMNNQPRALGQVAGPGFNPNFNNQFGNNNFNNMNRNTMMNTGNVIVQRLNCPRGFSVTHTENNPKNMVQLIWYPPVGFNRPIQFVATVVRDFNTYWMGHRSITLKSRPGLRMARFAGQTGRWYSSATRATSGVVILITSLCALLVYFL